MDGIELLGWWCTALSVAFVWPQVARVYRQHTVDGIAPKGTLHGATASALWMLYGLATGDVAISVANAAVVVAMVLIAAQQVRHHVLPLRIAVGTALVVVTVGGLAAAISPTFVGWLAIAAGATSVLPQTFHVLRAPNLHGVSVPTYLLLVLTTLSWATYGVLIGDSLVVATNLLVLPCAALVTARTWSAQRRAGATPLEDTVFA
jgi:uncharacterized protein with PQ loop repeat